MIPYTVSLELRGQGICLDVKLKLIKVLKLIKADRPLVPVLFYVHRDSS